MRRAPKESSSPSAPEFDVELNKKLIQAMYDRGDLVALGDYRLSFELSLGEDAKEGAIHTLFVFCDELFGELLKTQIAKLIRLLQMSQDEIDKLEKEVEAKKKKAEAKKKKGPPQQNAEEAPPDDEDEGEDYVKYPIWEATEAAKLRAQIAAADPYYASFTRNDWIALRDGKKDDTASQKDKKFREFYAASSKPAYDGYDSDDSDDEDEDDVPKQQRKIPQTFRRHKLDPAPQEIAQRVVQVRDQDADQEFPDRKKQQRDNARIMYPKEVWTKQADADFEAAKKAFAENDIAALQQLQTRFCIAQYRGITYKTLGFDEQTRRRSREKVELRMPIFSFSVFHAAGVSPQDYFDGRCSKEDLQRLTQTGEKLKAILLEKRKSKPIIVNDREFKNHADALQHIYTTAYDYFHSAVATYLAEKQGHFKKREALVSGKLKPTPILGIEEYVATMRQQFAAKKKQDIAKYRGERLDERRKLREDNDDRPKFDLATDAKVLEMEGEPFDEVACRAGYPSYKDSVEAENKKDFHEKVYGFEPPPEWEIYDGLLNGYCPFVSTGDVPRHALKYAYGMKFYPGHKNERLRPKWKPDGKAERPYSGKVFVSLHPLEDYLNEAPLHVPSKNLKGEIVITDLITDEREATFPAYIPADRLVIEHIAKFPSFDGEYDKLHMEKYGLTKEEYARYKKEVLDAQVQKDGEYRALEAWLVNFHEARLVELARRIAEEKGMILLYRDELGNLSRGVLGDISYRDAEIVDVVRGDKLNPKLMREARVKKVAGAKTSINLSPKNPIVAVSKSLWGEKEPLRVVLGREYVIHDTPGDGNCLFHALTFALADLPENVAIFTDHVTLRTTICDTFLRYPTLRQRQKVTDEYLQEMRQPATHPAQISRWGSDAEIMVFCRKYFANVRVYSPTYPPPHYADFTSDGYVNRELVLFHTGGNHWTWLTRK